MARGSKGGSFFTMELHVELGLIIMNPFDFCSIRNLDKLQQFLAIRAIEQSTLQALKASDWHLKAAFGVFYIQPQPKSNADMRYWRSFAIDIWRFAAVIMRIREPKTATVIFVSGKMVCTGAKNEHLSKLAARKVNQIVLVRSDFLLLRRLYAAICSDCSKAFQKLGFPAKFKDFHIQIIVACLSWFPCPLLDFTKDKKAGT